MRIPTLELSLVLRELAKVLDAEYQHRTSGERVVGALGIDSWSLAIQAETPDP